MKSYDHRKIEKKWQETWAKARLYETPDKSVGKQNFYLLVEFPYPSGNLHVGHWYSFAVPDILARKFRMEGKNVLYPIGFDAFGLPAENAAIKNKVNPREWTESNIEYMRKQLRSMGASFDWSREVVTCHPDYYKWTQWLFLQLYKSNLVYRKETMVNWCPNDKTVLANEQVVDGKCERCGAEVIQKEMLQWNIKITDYADRLIDDLKDLNWPEPIKESQRNWIGRSEGAEIDFPLEFERKDSPKPNYLLLHGYTGRADKNFIPWLKAELEKRGFGVQAPQLPNTDSPKESEQVEYVIAHCRIDEYTIIVGHSLGAIVAMKVLQKINRKIAGLFLIAPAVEPRFRSGEPRPFWKTFTWDFDYAKLKELSGFQMMLSDSLEAQERLPYLKHLSRQLNALLVEGTANRKHFTAESEPFILSKLLPCLTVFTTRPDTLFGATYLVLAPEHLWVTLALQHKTVLNNNDEVVAYVEKSKKKTELERQENREKTGVKLEGVEAINPATGEKIPLFVADYVLADYGTGAIMAVPAHDERDFEFAKKFELPIKQVVAPIVRATSGGDAVRADTEWKERVAVMAIIKHWEKDEYLCIQWKNFEMRTFPSGGIEEGESAEAAAAREVHEETGYKNVEITEQLGGVEYLEFYHQVKKTNVRARFRYVLGRLKNGERDEVSAQESAIHEIVWKRPEELRSFLLLKEKDRILDSLEGKEESAYTGAGYLINSAQFDGLTIEEAKKKMTEAFGRRKTTYKLRDWIVSRQRYWGVPIPVIHCPKCGIVPVPDEQLPVLLPETDDYLPDGKGKSPLAKVASFVNVKCPQCGGNAERETDTLDTFVDSSWYFLRYTDPRDAKEFAAKDKQANWMPVNLYSGGAEHTTMHLLYSRFWHKALFDRGLVADSEPYIRRMNRGIILGPDGQKMSKSKGNVIDPDDVVERLGADTVRMYLAFIGPYNEVASYPWNPDAVVGVRRFLERVWRAQEFVIGSGNLDDKKYAAIERALHRAMKKVGEDASQMKFNTAISQLMILLNAIEKEKQIGNEQWEIFLKLIAPFAPHMAEELWHEAGHDSSIHAERWPQFDPKLLQDEQVSIAVQIDGKTRDEIEIASGAPKEEIEKAAREKVASRLEGKTIVRTVVVPNRLVNFVTS